MDDKTLRRNLLELLDGGIAYPPVKTVLARLKLQHRAVRPRGTMHSVWEELEHMRIAQEDILRYTLDPNWKSPSWPAGYWPDPKDIPSASRWASTVKHFLAGLEELRSLVKDQKVDLTSEIPHGAGRTYLRQVLLAADHNAYHTGQIVLIRKQLGDWPS